MEMNFRIIDSLLNKKYFSKRLDIGVSEFILRATLKKRNNKIKLSRVLLKANGFDCSAKEAIIKAESDLVGLGDFNISNNTFKLGSIYKERLINRYNETPKKLFLNSFLIYLLLSLSLLITIGLVTGIIYLISPFLVQITIVAAILSFIVWAVIKKEYWGVISLIIVILTFILYVIDYFNLIE